MMEIIQGILIVLAAAACGTLAFYMVKGIVDMLTGKMRG
jgi:hypothetical protein